MTKSWNIYVIWIEMCQTLLVHIVREYMWWCTSPTEQLIKSILSIITELKTSPESRTRESTHKNNIVMWSLCVQKCLHSRGIRQGYDDRQIKRVLSLVLTILCVRVSSRYNIVRGLSSALSWCIFSSLFSRRFTLFLCVESPRFPTPCVRPWAIRCGGTWTKFLTNHSPAQFGTRESLVTLKRIFSIFNEDSRWSKK